MKFEIHMDNERIHQAAALVEKHYKDIQFLHKVEMNKTFNFTSRNGLYVAHDIRQSELTMKIKSYTTWNPFSKVIGHAKGDTIFINTRKLDLSLEDRIQNLFHEYLHLLGYKHKGNSVNEFNNGTVPFNVAKIFSQYVMSLGRQL